MKVNLKNITRGQWITFGSVLIIVIIVLIYIFRKVPTPPISDEERRLKIELDSAIKAHEQIERQRIIDSAQRATEIESLRMNNQEIRWQLNNVKREYEKKINGLRNATPAELEQFFSDRYE
jgi:uncharacterized membrane protein YvbJ